MDLLCKDVVRDSELKKLLEDTIDGLRSDIEVMKYDMRGYKESKGRGDVGDQSFINLDDDVRAALMQMREDNLKRCIEAEKRFKTGEYGFCKDCGGNISVTRLRALIFAVRCKDCEEAGEGADLSQRSKPPFPLFENSSSPEE